MRMFIDLRIMQGTANKVGEMKSRWYELKYMSLKCMHGRKCDCELDEMKMITWDLIQYKVRIKNVDFTVSCYDPSSGEKKHTKVICI